MEELHDSWNRLCYVFCVRGQNLLMRRQAAHPEA